MWFGSSGWVATADNTASRLVGLLVFLPFLFAGGPCSAGSGLDSAATSPAFAGFGLALLACSETFATSWAASSSVLALVRVSGAADAACAAFLSPRLGLSLAGGPFLVEALPASPGAGPGAGCVAPASGRASAAGRVGDAAFATGSSRSSPALAEAAREAFLAPAAGLGACAAAPAPFLVDFANGTAPLTAPPRAPGCGPGPVPSTLASNSAEALGSCCRSSFPRGSSPEFFFVPFAFISFANRRNPPLRIRKLLNYGISVQLHLRHSLLLLLGSFWTVALRRRLLCALLPGSSLLARLRLG
mmetsp:Transcript_17451/g.33356  ORF Transcript_17451/g.33356 Transcript_17451/m.33356 type:complete len:302 (-) Transcript_17451:1156-2061(-)